MRIVNNVFYVWTLTSLLFVFSACSDDDNISETSDYNMKYLESYIYPSNHESNIGVSGLSGQIQLYMNFTEEEYKMLSSAPVYGRIFQPDYVYYLLSFYTPGFTTEYGYRMSIGEINNAENGEAYVSFLGVYYPPVKGEYSFAILLTQPQTNTIYVTKLHEFSVSQKVDEAGETKWYISTKKGDVWPTFL